MNQQNESERPSSQSGWRRYLYTEEGVGLVFTAAIATWKWYDELFGKGVNYDSIFYRKLDFLEPFLGKHYIPMLFSMLAVILFFEVWRKGRK